MGGAAYSIGALFLIADAPTAIRGVVGPHELWHVAVLAGLTLHWLFVINCIEKAITEQSVDSDTAINCND